MRIPLDYYRILGLPIQTSAEQLQQAYRDRTQQLPQREYSQAGIEARNQLIAAAYTVLSDPEQRQRYDASYFAFTHETETNDVAGFLGAERPASVSTTFEPNTPSIEIAQALFVGALLILQELGEYELVLDLGRSFLSTNSFALESGDSFESNLVRSDIILTLALAYLELGREQWQQGQYENAAVSLESGENLLTREGLFLSVVGEIKADLDKLRPYRILELLARPEANATERQQGLQLLQEILQERRGIDGTGDDGSGLSVEDFLRFIQQLRSYLTAAEQQKLFEAESQRPSAVATYLTVYALIARGFAQRLPALIHQAKIMLMRLGKRQDLNLERAICSLLLGQTPQASQALELSQEYEPLAFIREHSQGSPDLLPGLCLYSESWLQNEVFPHFRDLAQKQASLKEYFADEQVQAYLEALPTDLEATDERTAEAEHQSKLLEAQANHLHPSSEQAKASESHSHNKLEQGVNNSLTKPAKEKRTGGAKEQRSQHRPGVPQRAVASTEEISATSRSNSFSEVTSEKACDRYPPVEATGVSRGEENQSPLNARHSPPVSGVAILSDTGHIAKPTTNQNEAGSEPSRVKLSSQRSKRRTRNRVDRNTPRREYGQMPFHHQGNTSTSARGSVLANKKIRLVLLLASTAIAVVILWFLASQVYGLFRQIFSQKPVLEQEQLMVELNQPAVSIPKLTPKPKSKPPAVADSLNQATAAQVIQSWLATKSAAFGSKHAIDKLEQILVEPALSQWQQRAQIDKENNRYRQYKHSIKVNAVQTKASAKDRAQVEATVSEVAQVYEKGRLNQADSYNEALRVRYDLVRQGGQWRIQAMKVLK